MKTFALVIYLLKCSGTHDDFVMFEGTEISKSETSKGTQIAKAADITERYCIPSNTTKLLRGSCQKGFG